MKTNFKTTSIIDTREIYDYIIDDLNRDSFEATEEQEENPNQEEIDYLEGILEEIGKEASYGVTLIEENEFEDYVQEMLEDCGDIPKNIPSYIEIDWEATAKNVSQDYSWTNINGIDYLYRG